MSRLLIPALLTALAAAAPVVAQSRPGAVAGVVKDSAGRALPNVQVTAFNAERSVRTDTAGEFTIGALPAGKNQLSFRRLGFEPVILSVDIPAADTADVDVILGTAAQQLTGVVVQGRAEPMVSALAAFESRRKQGIGHFITRAQIEQRHPLMLSDMLRTIPGAVLIGSDNGRTSVRFARVGRNNCPPQFFVDGIQVTGFSIDDMPPADVEGVELYAGSAGLPPEYNRLHGTSICGTVIIWSRIAATDRTKAP
jgi:hypothetical protein